MTTRTVSRRRRQVRRRHGTSRRTGGFWKGFRHATHTDQLRKRVGAAAGRALIRRINKHRVRRGKSPIPQRGGSWFDPTPRAAVRRPSVSRPGRPTAVRKPAGVTPKAKAPRVAGQPQGQPAGPTTGQRVKAAGARVVKGPAIVQTKGQAAKAGAKPVFSGPYVKVSNGTAAGRKVMPGTVSVTSSGLAGPGNRGAGAGTGIPAYGTGGAAGDGDHMISPGSAGGSATGGAPVGPGGLYGPNGGERAVEEDPRINKHQIRMWHPDDISRGSGGNGMTQPTTGTAGGSIDSLSEAPETDAEYLAALRGLSGEVRGWGDRIEEIQASLLENVGMDQAALGAYSAMAEHAQGLASAAEQAAIDFLNTYQGVIETAQSGVKIPGGEGRFFTGDVA